MSGPELGRRDLMRALAVSAATAFSRKARAQAAKKPVRVGFVPLGSASNTYDQSLLAAFRRGLRRVGLMEDRDVILDVVWVTRGPDAAVAEVLERGADILITCGSSASVAARRHTWTIPIVFISVGNPVGIGLAESTSRPGHNATGFSDILAALGGKLVGLTQDLNKPRRDIDYLWHTNWPDGQERFRLTQEAALTAGLNFRSRGVAELAEAQEAISELKSSGATTLLVQPSPFTYRQRDQLINLAAEHGLGTIFAFPIAAREGALMAYGPDYTHMHDRAPFYLDRILKGAKPADLPIEEASKLELVINLKTAKAIGVDVPLSLLVGADELIE
jgi:putative ABC transport system substrate-binding protein